MTSDSTSRPRAKVGQTYRVIGGDEITCKLLGDDTAGQYAVFETVTPPGAGPPPHVHHREDETFYIVEGQFEFYLEGRTVAAGPGSVVQAPRDLPHRFTNVGPTPGKLLITVQPAGLEHFFAEIAELPPDGPPDIERLTAIGARYGMQFLF